MAKSRKHRGGVNIPAAAESVALHIFLLGGLAAVRQPGVAANQTSVGATVSIRQETMKRQEPILTPVPKVRTAEEKKPVVQAKPIEKKPEPVKEPEKQAFEPVDAPVVEVLPGAVIAAKPAGVSLFGDKGRCERICYVVDCSGSMYGCFGQIIKELCRSISGLAESQSFYVIFFRDGGQIVESGKGRFTPATLQAKSDVFSLINGIKPAGKTLAKDALRRACRIRDGQGRCAEVIYFLTDGFDLQQGEGGSFAAEAADVVRELSPGAAVCTVGLWSSQQDKRVLRKLAELTGGRFIDVQAKDEQ